MGKISFDVFSALDGPCLNGMEGRAGVLRMRLTSDEDQLQWEEPAVKYFAGAFAGHAVQISPDGTIGFLGGWSETGRFFDPRTLEWLADYRSLDLYDGPRDVEHRSPTHVVFPPKGDSAWTSGFANRSCITTAGDYFWELDLSDLPGSVRHARPLAAHQLGLPHALKLSATGRYIFCGAADYQKGQRIRRIGIFEPRAGREGRMQIAHLERTSWHIQTHPTEDIMYAVTENYEEGDKNYHASWGDGVTIPVEGNYLWEVIPSTQEHAQPRVRTYGMSMDEPAHLTSDMVVVPNTDGSVNVLYNACASSTIVMVRLEPDGREQKAFPRFVEEGVWLFKGPHKAILRPGVLRAALRNLQEARWRGNLFTNHGYLRRRAQFVTRNTLVDGSYGLMLSPDNNWLISAHRGGNWFLVYKYPEVLSEGAEALAYRIKLPTAQQCLPGHACGAFNGALKDNRLGTHHCVVSTATVETVK